MNDLIPPIFTGEIALKSSRFFHIALLMSSLALPVGLTLTSAHAASTTATQGAQTDAGAAGKASTGVAPKKGDAAAVTADQILQKAGDTLFPENFTAQIEMSQHKPGAAANVSKMMMYKRGNDQVRADYIFPTMQAGQRILRKEGQIWMYMPDTKRAIKLSPKQSLGGSDFNNGDLMRLDLVQDYKPTIIEETPEQWVLELKARDRTVSYDMIKYTVSKKDYRSLKQEFYTLSGKMIKTMEFTDFKDYSGLKRPSTFLMKSTLAEGVYTHLKYLQFEPNKTLAADQFRSDALAKQ